VQSYLAIKYGVTLSQNTVQNYVNSANSVIWNGTTNATYNRDIAGIGRDDNSCLEQKQSKSSNAGTIVTIGNGGIFSNNGTNPNSFTADNSFLVWGNDAASATFANRNLVDVPPASSVTERMSRIWKVQESGTVGNQSVSFDLAGLGYDLSSSSAFQLMVSPNSTIANATTIVGGTLVGSVITFNNIDFNNGDFFTLGTARDLCGPGGVITDLALWLRADEGTGTTTNNTDLNTWGDQSTTGRDATEVNLGGAVPAEPKYLTSQFNFNPAIQIFDPNSSNASFIRTTNGNSVSADFSLISVLSTGQSGGSTTNFEDAPAILSTGSADNLDYGIGMSEGRPHINAANNNTLNARSPSSPLFNTQKPFIVTGTRIQATSAGSVQLYVNSANVASGVSTNNALTTPTTFGIGNHSVPNVASQFNGKIAESIVYSDDLTANERQRVESYLAVKYGITRNAGGTATEDYLAADSGIIWDWSEQPSYSNNIAGIGRDDNSCFVQPKSKSNNDGSLVTMEVVGTFASDDSFMLWGNNNVAVEATQAQGNTEFDPSQVSSRLFREWYVQEAASAVGTVTLTYDLATVTGPSGLGTNNLNQVRLMVDADGNFASGATLITPTSIDAINKRVTFTVNLNDTQFFTLGSLEKYALPITLISFDAKKTVNNEVNLTWATADETNNAYFTVERSSNGVDFESIGTVVGAGNSDVTNNYSLTDKKPLAGNNFYRLKQTDFNGEFSLSEIKRAFFEFKFTPLIFSLYPNPVSIGEMLTLNYSVGAESKINIKVVSMSGQLLSNMDETIYPESGNIKIDTSHLQRGLNIVIISNLKNNQQQSFRVIVR
jgi:hypothetical protein